MKKRQEHKQNRGGEVRKAEERIMSSNLVKRLLRVSAESLAGPQDDVRPTKRQRREKKKQQQRRHSNSNADAAEEPVATPDEIMASRVRQMLALDRTRQNHSHRARKLRHNQHKEQDQTEKQHRTAIVTNSRSAALQATVEHQKTSTKETQQKEQEERRQKNIAKMLKKLNKSKKKEKVGT